MREPVRTTYQKIPETSGEVIAIKRPVGRKILTDEDGGVSRLASRTKPKMREGRVAQRGGIEIQVSQRHWFNFALGIKE